MQKYHQEFQATIGQNLVAGLNKVTSDLGQQSKADKDKILSALKNMLESHATNVAENCRQKLDNQVHEFVQDVQAKVGTQLTNFHTRVEKVGNEVTKLAQRVPVIEAQFLEFGQIADTKFDDCVRNFKAMAEAITNLENKVAAWDIGDGEGMALDEQEESQQDHPICPPTPVL